jgi:hypothetical protein
MEAQMDQRRAAVSAGWQSGARCPFCAVDAAEHDAGPCLDRWIHEQFFQKILAQGQLPPPYSASPQQPCLEALIEAPKWPQGVAVMQTSVGCTIGRRTPRGDRLEGYEYYHVIATAETFPLAVCRAALICLSSPGSVPLRIT